MSLALLFLACSAPPPSGAPAPAPAPAPAAPARPEGASAASARLTVRGVGLGSSEAEVIAALGEARSIEPRPYDAGSDMGAGPWRDLRYDGATVSLCQPEGQPAPRVCAWTLQGTGWSVDQGAGIGSPAGALTHALGPAEERSREDDSTELWSWPVGEGDSFTIVKLREGKVVEIRQLEDYS